MLLRRRNGNRLDDARNRDLLVRSQRGRPRLTLAAHLPAGRMQLDPDFLVRLRRIGRLAVSKQADPFRHQSGHIPLHREIDVLSRHDAARRPRRQHGVRRGARRDPGRARHL